MREQLILYNGEQEKEREGKGDRKEKGNSKVRKGNGGRKERNQ